MTCSDRVLATLEMLVHDLGDVGAFDSLDPGAPGGIEEGNARKMGLEELSLRAWDRVTDRPLAGHKFKNREALAVKREAEEDWSK